MSKLDYKKTPEDLARERSDLNTSPIMRFLKNRDQYTFNIGDILIKETRWDSKGKWEISKTAIGGIKKYMYVFENELGIGYIKQLKVDGTGFTTNISCVANYDPETVRLSLDPDYADHLLIGENEFNYNDDYLRKKEFRQEAIKRNRSLVVNTRNEETRMAWYHSLKDGDTIWASWKLDDLHAEKYKVVEAFENTAFPCPNHVPVPGAVGGYWNKSCTRQLIMRKQGKLGDFQIDNTWFAARYVAMSQPFPLVDDLCGHQK